MFAVVATPPSKRAPPTKTRPGALAPCRHGLSLPGRAPRIYAAAVPLQPIVTGPAQGIVDANGNVSIKFPNVPPMQVWTATVSVPASTPDVKWTAAISGVPVASFYGSSPAGPFSLPPQGQLTLSASNLKTGTIYAAMMQGSAVEQDLADPSPAAAPPATNAVSVINEEVFAAGPIVASPGPTTVILNVPPAWSVLHLLCITGNAGVQITGVQSGYGYLTHLVGVANVFIAGGVVPVLIDPALDSEVNITVVQVGAVAPTIYVTAQLNSSVMVLNNSDTPLYIAGGASPSGSSFPVDVVPYGGSRTIIVPRAAAGTSAVLPAPSAGTAYRLQRAVLSTGAGTTLAQLNGHTSGFIYSFSVASIIDNMFGTLVSEALDWITAGGGGTLYLSYDVVTTPTIS